MVEQNRIDDVLNALGGTAKRASEAVPPLKVIPTGIEILDNHVLGIGGFPMGRAIEIAGKPSSGKTTLCQWLGGSIQRRNGIVWWADVEGTLTKKYAKDSGLILEELIWPELGQGEDVLEKMKLALAINKFDAIIIDSIGATKSKDHSIANMNTKFKSAVMWADFWDSLTNGYEIGYPEIGKAKKEKDDEEDEKEKKEKKAKKIKNPVLNPKAIKVLKEGKLIDHYGLHKLVHKPTTLLCINHLMVKPGVQYGSKERTSGGDKKDFAFTLRLKVSVVKTNRKKNGTLVSKKVKVETKKNKVGIPLRACELMMLPNGKIEGLQTAEPTIYNDDDDSKSGFQKPE